MILKLHYFFLHYIYSQVLTTICYTFDWGGISGLNPRRRRMLIENDRIQDANWTFLEALHRFEKPLYAAIS